MSDLLRITVEFDPEHNRHTLHFDRQIADDPTGMGYGDVGPQHHWLSDEFSAALHGGEWGAYKVEVPHELRYWAMSFELRPGITLDRALELLLPILAHFCSVQYALIRMA